MYENYLNHKGVKGSKWGYNDGKPNGKRKAGDGDKQKRYIKPSKFNGVSGYSDENNKFFPGSSKEALRTKQKWDNSKQDRFLKPHKQNGVSGYVDETGRFFPGNSDAALKAKQKRDIDIANLNAETTKLKLSMTTSMDTFKDECKDAINKGKKFLNKLFD